MFCLVMILDVHIAYIDFCLVTIELSEDLRTWCLKQLTAAQLLSGERTLVRIWINYAKKRNEDIIHSIYLYVN